jgi:hypothetical protein
MANAAGVKSIYPIDSYTRRLLDEFETAIFNRAIVMSKMDEGSDPSEYGEAKAFYEQAKASCYRRISKLTATPNVEPDQT